MGYIGPIRHVYRIPQPVEAPAIQAPPPEAVPEPLPEPAKAPQREPVKVGAR